MQRVLILRSNPIAPDPRVEKIAAALLSHGYYVRALGWDRFGHSPSREDRQGFLIERLPIIAGFGKGLGNIGPLVRWQLGLLAWLMKNRASFDIVHACDFDTILPSLLCKFLSGKKIIYDIFDFYADHLRATPGWIKRIIRRIDYWAISRADAIIIVDEARKKQIDGAVPKRLEIIYNSPQDSETVQRQGEERANKSTLNIAYVGLLQIERGILFVLEVMARNPNWVFDLAGFGGDEHVIREKSNHLCNVNWHGRVDYDCALALSQQADVLFATYDPDIPNHRYSSPNKVFEAMMLGKPIVVSKDTNMDRIILEADCGLVVQFGNVDELENAFRVILQDDDLRSRLGRNARRAYETKYSWKIMGERLVRLYDQVCP